MNFQFRQISENTWKVTDGDIYLATLNETEEGLFYLDASADDVAIKAEVPSAITLENVSDFLTKFNPQLPQPSEVTDVYLKGMIDANGVDIARVDLVSIDTDSGKLSCDITMLTDDYKVDCDNYVSESGKPDLQEDEIVTSFYMTCREICKDLSYKIQ